MNGDNLSSNKNAHNEVCISVNISFLGDELNPDLISSYLNCKPSKSWKKGDVKKLKNDVRGFIYPWGGWVLESEDTELENINESIIQLIDSSGIECHDMSDQLFEKTNGQIEVSIFGKLQSAISIRADVFYRTQNSRMPIVFSYFGE